MRYIILIAGIVVVLSGFWFRSQKKTDSRFCGGMGDSGGTSDIHRSSVPIFRLDRKDNW